MARMFFMCQCPLGVADACNCNNEALINTAYFYIEEDKDGRQKKLCKLKKKELKENLMDYKKIVKDATHVCSKCGRTCNDKKRLCSSEAL
ncbi:hypothetical protein [Clostridium aceticum]|uniref:hypothetical protein n=1 Tax=Clostridium aceticum TaxID=84022 RepID=UPI0005CF3772|nr:hypothetical protein [Clostridium aceticum]KJF26476.1 hypothetical protein TZ02_13180 [Clostridium aceticum]